MAQPSSFVLKAPQGKDKYGPGDLPSLIDRKVHLGLSSFTEKYVGAVGLGSSGIAYLGISVEFPGILLQYGIDAEKVLVANLVLNFERHLTHLAVSSDGTNFVAPCEHCLFFLQSIHNQPNILIKNQEINEYFTFASIHRLAVPERAYLLEVSDNLLEVIDNGLRLLDADGEDPDGMKHTALYAANRSFSPFKRFQSGVALKDRDQKVYKGWYMESLAMGRSGLGPLQAALVDFMIRGGTNFEDIVEAVLVEKIDAEESQAGTASMILWAIAPNCRPLTVFYCL